MPIQESQDSVALEERSQMRRFKDAIGSCIKLADPTRNANMLLLYLQCRLGSLESVFSGDSSR